MFKSDTIISRLPNCLIDCHWQCNEITGMMDMLNQYLKNNTTDFFIDHQGEIYEETKSIVSLRATLERLKNGSRKMENILDTDRTTFQNHILTYIKS